LPTILIEMCPLTLSYKQDGSGARSSDKGLLLIPAPAPGGNAGNVSASGGNMPNDPFEKSATFRDAVLVDLESPREFFNVSRKFSMDCRRSQASGWKTEGLTSTSAEVARANIRTHIGEAFLARELVVPGLEPVKAPQTMATGITKAGVEKFLPTPMAQLNLAADGKLAIPTEQELKDNPLVSLTPELLSYFEKLREEFSPVPAAGGDGNSALALPGTDKQPDPGASILKAGDIVGNRSELHGLLHSKIRKEVQQNGERGVLLVEVEDTAAPHRVLIENRSNAHLKLAAGTFVGRGGPGSLVSAPPAGRQLLHSWLYTRCSEWKRDVATRGNGFWVFKKPASGGGQGAAAGAEKPCLQTLERVMPDVAVEEFDILRLGAWVPSREQQTATGLECVGLLRPAFEVQLDGPNKKTLTPNANPATGGNPLCLFLKKNLVLKPGQLAVL